MTYSVALQRVLWTVSSGSAAFALYRSFQLRLQRRYPAFSCYLTLIVLQYVCLVSVPINTNAYRIAWICFEPLIGVGIVAIAVEAYIRLSGSLSTDAQFRILIGSGVAAVGVIASLLSWPLDGKLWDGAMQFAFWSRRYVASTLSVALFVSVLLRRGMGTASGTRAERNARVHVVLMVVYLLTTSIGFMSINALSGQAVEIANVVMSAVFAFVFLCWGAGMRSEEISADALDDGLEPAALK